MRSEKPLAKAASASRPMARVSARSARAGGQGTTLTPAVVAGFVARNSIASKTTMIDKTYQPARGRGPHLPGVGSGGRLPRRPARARGRRAVLYRHPAAQRHRLIAYGPCAQQHAAGYPVPLRAHARASDVLWQPGTDHAGIATQMVVERQLMERQQPGRREMGREAFLKRVWEWKAESGGAIVNQLKRLGASCDWSRERFTMDEGLSRAVVKVFVELYREGLIYKDKRLVNWDPKLLTAISDLEVMQVETKGHLWHFRYPIEGETRSDDITSASPPRGRRPCSATPRLRCIPTTSATSISSASWCGCRWPSD